MTGFASPPGPPPLRRDAAFVVQLAVESDVGSGRVVGRVEHVRSGEWRRFSTIGELLAFVAKIEANLDPGAAPSTGTEEAGC